MRSITDFRELLVHQLQDLHSNVQQMSFLLPKMSEVASNSSLRDALRDGGQRTQQQRKHVIECLQSLQAEQSEVPCRAMIGMIEEGNHTLDIIEDSAVRDAALVIIAQKMLHYGMTSCESLKSQARQLNERKIVERMDALLKDQAKLDRGLTEMAESSVKEKVMSRR